MGVVCLRETTFRFTLLTLDALKLDPGLAPTWGLVVSSLSKFDSFKEFIFWILSYFHP